MLDHASELTSEMFAPTNLSRASRRDAPVGSSEKAARAVHGPSTLRIGPVAVCSYKPTCQKCQWRMQQYFHIFWEKRLHGQLRPFVSHFFVDQTSWVALTRAIRVLSLFRR